MNPKLPGIHHVTAITADAQRNIDFYTGVLGLRLVKLTVNFDDPGSYHLYYGDQTGSPGSIMTFFVSPGAGPGRVGAGQVSCTRFLVSKGSLRQWQDRLPAARPSSSFGETGLSFTDPDGLPLELVESELVQGSELAGFHGVTLSVARLQASAAILRELGFELHQQAGDGQRWRAPGATVAGFVDLMPARERAALGAGVVHHLAFRTPDQAQQREWQQRLQAAGQVVSPVLDRKYFHSIYFREASGVLFEIATDPPGFTVDQPVEELGTRLVLPDWLEPKRASLEAFLPKVRLPARS